MTIRVKIKHDEESSERLLAVSVVTVGNPAAPHDIRVLKGGEQTEVHVHGGQLVFVEETDSKELKEA